VDDNIWEYPFGELEDDEEIFFLEPSRPENSKKQD
jgi:hypothetical protein